MKQLAYYSVVRFMPYVETEEFVNAGVVLLCPKTGYFGFELAHRWGRVGHFFDTLDAAVYRNALKKLHEELNRVRNLLTGLRGEAAEAVFADLTEPRESLLRFRQPRAVLTADPEHELAEKFGFYVEHDFATKEYQERLVVKAVRQVLVGAGLQRRYQPQDVGNEDFHLPLQMVHLQDEKPTAAIKPLFLGDDEPTRIYDKGTHWAGKLRLLREVGGFEGAILFALQAPTQGAAGLRAFQNAHDELREAGAVIALTTQPETLINFARTH